MHSKDNITVAALLMQCGGEIVITDDTVRKLVTGRWEVHTHLNSSDKSYTYRLVKVNDVNQRELIPVNQTDEE